MSVYNKILWILIFSFQFSYCTNDLEVPIGTTIHHWSFFNDAKDSDLFHISYFDHNTFLDYSINWKKKEFRANYGGANEFISGSNIMDVLPKENFGSIVKDETVIWKKNSLEIITKPKFVRKICKSNHSILVIKGTLIIPKHSKNLECNFNNINLDIDFSSFEFRKNLKEEFLDINHGNRITHSFYHKKLEKAKNRGMIKTIYYFLQCKSELKNSKEFDLYSSWKKIERYSEIETLTIVKDGVNQFYYLPASSDEFEVFRTCPKATLNFLKGNF
ncbi:MAG: hypothetical protein SFU98_13715 [Leptospiraceae bacterium]|nr:hypothetical protein [Leptospiraceae bacterium]